MDANKVEIHGRAFYTDEDLDTTAQDVAGGINELHTQLDSAVGEIESEKVITRTHLDIIQSGGTTANMSGTGISTLGTTSKFIVPAINEIHTQLDSAVGEIEVVKGRVTSNDTDILNLSNRVGLLYQLDSSTPGNFFEGINNDSIVKALNELANRTVLIYDENGTLLN
jgi:ABC-type phosphate transport system ATPase subunit